MIIVKNSVKILLLLAISLLLLVCSNGGPEPGFDVTGVWTEKGGNSMLKFTEEGGFILNFSPSLSDGTEKFEGDSYTRVDNANVTFRIIMGRFEIVNVEANINSNNVLSFKLDGRTYKFIKE